MSTSGLLVRFDVFAAQGKTRTGPRWPGADYRPRHRALHPNSTEIFRMSRLAISAAGRWRSGWSARRKRTSMVRHHPQLREAALHVPVDEPLDRDRDEISAPAPSPPPQAVDVSFWAKRPRSVMCSRACATATAGNAPRALRLTTPGPRIRKQDVPRLCRRTAPRGRRDPGTAHRVPIGVRLRLHRLNRPWRQRRGGARFCLIPSPKVIIQTSKACSDGSLRPLQNGWLAPNWLRTQTHSRPFKNRRNCVSVSR